MIEHIKLSNLERMKKMTYNQIILIVFIAWTILLSCLTFLLFRKDKKMAQGGGGKVRIKEKTLLSFTALGGALGAFIGRIVCHHKTEKKYFSFTIYLALFAEIIVLAALVALAVEVK